MTYDEAYNYLIKSYTQGSKRGHECLKAVLSRFGSPQDSLNIIHVAGTNGKGSTCAMLASVLSAAGYRTGTFTSPHLHRFNERFSIDGRHISDEAFARHICSVKGASEELFGNTGEMLSYFEILTLVCFLYFNEQKVDYLLLETGIGGRLDATNIIHKPVLSVITAIGMDHTEYLGDSIEKIAREKGGIIKNNCPAVLYSQSEEVYNIIDGICKHNGSKLYYARDIRRNAAKNDLDGVSFSVTCEYYAYENVALRLTGEYQMYNACTVLTAVHALRASGVSIPEDSVLRGLYAAEWAGRMEVVSRDPLIVLDGAHNYEAALTVRRSMETYFAGRSVTLIIGILKDKEYGKIINLLSENADRVILTKPVYGARALETSALLNEMKDSGKPVFAEDNYSDAVELAFDITPDGGVIFCSGSLYLVGDVRAYLKRRR